ncbi:MAG: PcfJ domain-containing protein, partial [Clostridia bacterium]
HCGRRVKLVEDRTATFYEVLVTQVLDNFCDNRQIVQFYKITYFTKYKNVEWTTSKLEFDITKGDFLSRECGCYDVICYKNGKDCSAWYNSIHETGWRLGRFAVSGGTGLNSTNFGKFLYVNNLPALLSAESKSIATFIKFAKENKVNNALEYLSRYELTPQIEYLIKLGFTKLAIEFLKGRVLFAPTRFKLSENNIIKFLGCPDKNYFKKLPKKVSSEDLAYSNVVKQKFGIEIFDSNYAKYKTFLKYRNGALDEIEKYTSFKTVLNYYETQKTKEKSILDFLIDYRDYIYAASTLKLNLNDTAILKPRDFRSMHDRTCAALANLQDKRRNEPFKAAMKEYHLNFEDETYKIIIPNKIADVVDEGRNNNNCVGGYVNKIIDRRSIIVFVRDKKELEKSLVTVEIDPATFKIIQVRARSNSAAPDEVTNFLNTYAQKVLEKQRPKTARAS